MVDVVNMDKCIVIEVLLAAVVCLFVVVCEVIVLVLSLKILPAPRVTLVPVFTFFFMSGYSLIWTTMRAPMTSSTCPPGGGHSAAS